MSRKYKFVDDHKLYFVTYTAVHWIDVFTRVAYKNIILDSLEYCIAKKGLKVYAWCIMTNHVHLIIGADAAKFEHILRDHKAFTSITITRAIRTNAKESRREWILQLLKNKGQNNSNNTSYQFWQQHNKPIELYSRGVISKYLDYIHYNPVRAGFVSMPEHWVYSSAGDYLGKPGLLPLSSLADAIAGFP